MANKPRKAVDIPQTTNPTPVPNNTLNEPQSALQSVAQNELRMLDINAQHEEMMNAMPKKIGQKEINEANKILREYKKGKANLEKKLIANEEFWKLRQWRFDNTGDENDFTPASAWLWSCIQSRYSDAMDSYPTCNLKPRQEDDKQEAKMLSDIIPVVMEQNRYEETYSDVVWYMLKQGGAVQGIFWDGQKNGGLGDVTIKKIDFMNLFWESGITNIQESENVFNTELVSNKIIEQRYPQCRGKLGGKSVTLAKYLYNDEVNTDGKSVVVDWYYKTEYNGRKCVHLCKFVNDILLYATENDTTVPTSTEIDPQTGIPVTVPIGEALSERGLYDHGLYPFVVQALFPIEGSLCGYGITDIGKDAQIQIDCINRAITENALDGASPRWFEKGDGGVNTEELLNRKNKIVHVAGNISDDYLREIPSKTLAPIYENVLLQKIEEIKYVTSNQDVNNGAAPSGITAASAIAALQETSGKNARSSNRTMHRMYREVVYQVVELIRQFYDTPRTFRIVPDSMGEQFVSYSNAGIKPQVQQNVAGQMGYRLPEFDIDVTSEKANPYKKMEQNELALNFYNLGFFNPQMTDQAIACLEMMDFNGKDELIQKLRLNGTLQQMLLQYQQMALQLAQQVNPALAEQIGGQILGMAGSNEAYPQTEGVGDANLDGMTEHPFVEKSREQARASTQAE